MVPDTPSPTGLRKRKSVIPANVDFDRLLYRLDRAILIEALEGRLIHDLRNPLQAITMAAAVLSDEASDSARSPQLIQAISSAAGKLEKILRQGTLPPLAGNGSAAEPFAIGQVVQSAVDLVGRMRPSGNISIVVELPKDIPPVLSVSEQVLHALLNLLLNAREQLDAHGGGAIRVVGADDGKFVRLVVEDDGPGLTAEVAERAFEPFFSTKPEHLHLGLGLPVASHLVQSHGGSLTLEQHPKDLGGCFVVRLPAVPRVRHGS